jgi:hypothetical protein
VFDARVPDGRRAHSASAGQGDASRCIQFSSAVLVAVDASCRFRQRSRLRHSFALHSGSLLRYRNRGRGLTHPVLPLHPDLG